MRGAHRRRCGRRRWLFRRPTTRAARCGVARDRATVAVRARGTGASIDTGGSGCDDALCAPLSEDATQTKPSDMTLSATPDRTRRL
jgi:hypothetical protein